MGLALVRRNTRPVVLATIIAGLITSACFGKVAVGVTNEVQPLPILPGAQLRQDLTVEADGALGGAIRQSMSQATSSGSGSPAWDIRDNSDGSTVRMRATRTVPLGDDEIRMDQSGNTGLGANRVRVSSTDYVVVRQYRLRVTVPPASTTPASTSTGTAGQLGDQLTKALVAGITFDEYAVMPGFVTATNGVPGDNGRLVWHLQIDSTSERELTAESLYVDWPRLAAILILLIAIAAIVIVSRRQHRPFSGPTPATW